MTVSCSSAIALASSSAGVQAEPPSIGGLLGPDLGEPRICLAVDLLDLAREPLLCTRSLGTEEVLPNPAAPHQIDAVVSTEARDVIGERQVLDAPSKGEQVVPEVSEPIDAVSQ
jgi:hypothetical protein